MCNYCKRYLSSGLDRIDSSIGYESNNVVPCCKVCNRMKDVLSTDEFLAAIEAVNRVRQITRTKEAMKLTTYTIVNNLNENV